MKVQVLFNQVKKNRHEGGRGTWSEGDRIAAAATGRDVGVVEFEPAAYSERQVVERGPAQELLADRVDDDVDALDDVPVVRVLGLVEVQIVLEAGTAAALHLQAQDIGLGVTLFSGRLDDLVRVGFLDFFRGFGGYLDWWGH